jgi:hypothetical protein
MTVLGLLTFTIVDFAGALAVVQFVSACAAAADTRCSHLVSAGVLVAKNGRGHSQHLLMEMAILAGGW